MPPGYAVAAVFVTIGGAPSARPFSRVPELVDWSAFAFSSVCQL